MTCEHISFLAKPQSIPGTKRQVKFLDYGYIVNMKTGKGEFQPILRGLKETPSGRITVTSDWHPLLFCPVCGVKTNQEVEPLTVEELVEEAQSDIDYNDLYQSIGE